MTQLEKLKAQRDRIENRIRQLAARESALDRKRELRKIFLLGQYVATNPDLFQFVVQTMQNEGALTRPSDLKALGLNSPCDDAGDTQ